MRRNPVIVRLAAVAIVLIVPLIVEAVGGGYPLYPDPRLTPGQAFPTVTAHDVCQPGYAGHIRNVPNSVKNQVFQRYGIHNPRPGAYEIDHFISLELGGTNDISNLWPQPYTGTWNAHHKDHLEDTLHSLVCQGRLTLRQAQQAITSDWIAAYKHYVLGQ